MTRCIAIVTLALTAVLSADQAFALDPGNCSSALRTGVMIVNEGGGSDDYQPGEFELNPGDCVSALRDADDLELLVAFVAYEYGTEAACEMLLELGYSPALAEDLVLEAIAIYGVQTYISVSIVDSGGGTD